jgi:hypothetical protein
MANWFHAWRALRFAVLAVPLLFNGCLRQTMVDAQIRAVRDASAHGATLHDFEIASVSSQSGIVQLEGLYALSPANRDVLFMLTRGWAGVAFAFLLDEHERAVEAGDEAAAEYHLMRARAAFARARFFGTRLIATHADGFEQAKRTGGTLEAWLAEGFDEPEQAEDLLWVSFAWLSHAASAADDPEIFAELYVGLEILKRSMKLDEAVGNGTGHMLLGTLLARPVGGDLPLAKRHFERAIAINAGKYLPPKLLLATRYYCAAGDRSRYEQTLREIAASPDSLPERRVMNLMAKRRARRYLQNAVFQRQCAFS